MEPATPSSLPPNGPQATGLFVPPHLRGRASNSAKLPELPEAQPDLIASTELPQPTANDAAPSPIRAGWAKGPSIPVIHKTKHRRSGGRPRQNSGVKLGNHGLVTKDSHQLGCDTGTDVVKQHDQDQVAKLNYAQVVKKAPEQAKEPPQNESTWGRDQAVLPTSATTQEYTEWTNVWDTSPTPQTTPLTKHTGGHEKVQAMNEHWWTSVQPVEPTFKQEKPKKRASHWDVKVPKGDKLTRAEQAKLEAEWWDSWEEEDMLKPLRDPGAATQPRKEWDTTHARWSGPEPYDGSHLLKPMVNAWIEKTCAAFHDGIPVVDISPASKFTTANTAEGAQHEILGDVVPRYWALQTVGIEKDQTPTQQFWKEHFYEDYIKEEDPGYKPFWQNWVNDTYDCQHLLVVPHPRMDPYDEGYLKHAKDHGVVHRIDALLNKKKEKKKRLRKARKDELAREQLRKQTQQPPNPLHSTINMVIRYVDLNSKTEIRDITAIYNHYVKESVFVEQDRVLTAQDMHGRLADILGSNMPVLVAVEKPAARPGNVRNFKKPEGKIIGFVYVDDLGERGTQNAYSGDLEIFVDPTYAWKAVGSNLLDRTLSCLDDQYPPKGNCEWKLDIDWPNGGGIRRIRSVFCHMPYDVKDRERKVWIGGWLENFGFKEVGDLPEVGWKLGQSVNVAIYRYKTWEGSYFNPLPYY